MQSILVMNRRRFIRNAAGVFVPSIFIPRLIRAQAFSFRDVAFVGKTTAASGPNAWFDVQAQPGDGNDLGETNAAYAWTNITLTQGGTATKLRVYIGTNFGSFDCKMALYDNSGNLVSSGGPVTFSANGYLEVPITNAAVTATTYRIAWEMSNSNSGVARLSSGGGGAKSYCAVTLAYASFPDNPNGTCVGPFTANYCVGIFVQ